MCAVLPWSGQRTVRTAFAALAFTVFIAPRLICSMAWGLNRTLAGTALPPPLDRGRTVPLATVQVERAEGNDPRRHRRRTRLRLRLRGRGWHLEPARSN